MRRVLVGALAACLTGCGSERAAVSNEPAAINNEPAVYLGNPRFGIRIGPDGTGRGLPAFQMHGGRFGRSINPASVEIDVEGAEDSVTHSSHLDFLTGVYTVERRGKALLEVERPRETGGSDASGTYLRISTVVDSVEPIVAQRFKSNARIRIASPHADNLHSWETIDQIDANTIERVSGTRFEKPNFRYDDILNRSKAHFAKLFQTRIIIDGPEEDQRAIDSFLFYLYISGNEMLPPMGLSSAKYGGRRFWDGEAWMLPVYALIQPDVARAATEWRAGRVLRRGHIPWEAGPDGEDLTPKEFRNAIHVAGWVAWWMERATAFGFIDTKTAGDVAEVAFRQFEKRAFETPSGIQFPQVKSPDEGRLHNNDLVTNLLAKGVAQHTGRYEWSTRIVVPLAGDKLLSTYDDDGLNTYQQTAALLALYPLEWPIGRRIQERMFDRYKDKTSEVGPAMSDCIHAVIAARLGRPEEAHDLWKRSWVPFVDANTQFRERRGSQDTYFVTGAAGCLQSVIYGFLGVRISKKATRDSSVPMRNGYHLSVRPSLPGAWRSITFKNLRIGAGRYTVIATQSGARIIVN
ncbi:MAG: hypothetical protein ACR2HJ_00200 [Fimbriimonadales bacterium]